MYIIQLITVFLANQFSQLYKISLNGRESCIFPQWHCLKSFQWQLLITHRQGLEVTWMVYLHTPRVFQSLMVLSREPETICRLSAEKATLKTSLVWPTNRRVVAPLGKTPNRIVTDQNHYSSKDTWELSPATQVRVDVFNVLCQAFTKQEKSFLFGKENHRQRTSKAPEN